MIAIRHKLLIIYIYFHTDMTLIFIGGGFSLCCIMYYYICIFDREYLFSYVLEAFCCPDIFNHFKCMFIGCWQDCLYRAPRYSGRVDAMRYAACAWVMSSTWRVLTLHCTRCDPWWPAIVITPLQMTNSVLGDFFIGCYFSCLWTCVYKWMLLGQDVFTNNDKCREEVY